MATQLLKAGSNHAMHVIQRPLCDPLSMPFAPPQVRTCTGNNIVQGKGSSVESLAWHVAIFLLCAPTCDASLVRSGQDQNVSNLQIMSRQTREGGGR